jgi:hypothetical protein
LNETKNKVDGLKEDLVIKQKEVDEKSAETDALITKVS